MSSLKMVKLGKQTHLFNRNQKCWIITKPAGMGDCKVKAKHRGNGRYIEAWIHYSDFDHKTIKEVEVTDEFYKKITGFL